VTAAAGSWSEGPEALGSGANTEGLPAVSLSTSATQGRLVWSRRLGHPPAEQMDLHAFFAHANDLTDDQALAHRVTATKQDPSLPQIAGRLYAKIKRDLVNRLALEPASTASRRKPETNVKVEAFGLMRPSPNLEKLYDAIFMMVEQEMQREDDALASRHPSSAALGAMSTLRRAVRQRPVGSGVRFRRAGRRARRRRP